MENTRRTVIRVIGLMAVVIACLSTDSIFAQLSSELKVVTRIEMSSQPAIDVEYYLGPGQTRWDMAESSSLIWTNGNNPSFPMVQHSGKTYIEWGSEQLRMLQQMMQRTSGGDATSASEVDPSQFTFAETGNREQIGEWDAFEVHMTGPEGQEGALWLSNDVDTGLLEVSSRVAEATSVLSMPMTGAEVFGPQRFAEYRAIAAAKGLHDGRVVRINTYGNDDTKITLMSVETGPLPPDTFQAPVGYEHIQMPSLLVAREKNQTIIDLRIRSRFITNNGDLVREMIDRSP